MTLGDDRAIRQTYIAGEPALKTKLQDKRATSSA